MFDRVAKLERVYERFPGAPVFARLADACLHKGRLMRAQVLCQEGCERFPNYPTGYFVLGRCYEVQRLWEEARTALDRGLRLDPDNPSAYRRLSRVYRELGNPTLALKCLERAGALDPLSPRLASELQELAARLRTAVRAEPTAQGLVQDLPADTGLADEGLFDGEESGIPGVSRGLEFAALSDQSPVTPGEGDALVAAALRTDSGGAEPFGQLQPQSDWDAAPAIPLKGEPAEPAAVPRATPEATVGLAALPSATGRLEGGDEVAALGAGLFDDDRVDRPGPSAEPRAPSAPLPAAPSRAPEATPSELKRGMTAPPSGPAGPGPKLRRSLPLPAVESPVARFSTRDDGQLGELLAQIQADQVPATGRPRPGEPESGPIATVTLAALYARLGYPDRALDTYRRLLRSDPGNEVARRGLADLGG